MRVCPRWINSEEEPPGAYGEGRIYRFVFPTETQREDQGSKSTEKQKSALLPHSRSMHPTVLVLAGVCVLHFLSHFFSWYHL